MDPQTSHPLKPLVGAWLSVLRLGRKDKKTKFQDDADEAMSFFDNSGDWLELNSRRAAIRNDGMGVRETILPPSFEMRVNKVAEMRDLFGPALYHTNPVITVEPHDQIMVPPQALGIDPDAMGQMQQQFAMNPMMQGDPQAMQQMQMLQQQFQQYQMLSKQQATDKVVNDTRAELLRRSLNYMQFETDKKTHARRAVDEALVMGAGVLWTEVDTSTSGTKLVGSYYDSVKRLLIDPDARVWEDVRWIARECIHPHWQVEEDYGLAPGTLKNRGSTESYEQEADLNADPEALSKKANGKSNDLVRYFKVYSKMGMGARLRKSSGDAGFTDEMRSQLEEFGEYCYLVLVEGVPYPINLPQDAVESYSEDDTGNSTFQFPREIVTQDAPPQPDPMTGQPVPQEPQPVIDPETGEPQTQLKSDVFLSFQWPIPFWADDEWPMELLGYRERPNEIWPMPIVKSGIGELRFINWVMSFLAVKVRRCCQTTVGVPKSADENIKSQLLSGSDFNIIELEELTGKRIDEIVSFLQAPQFNPEIWTMLSQVFDLFDKRVGLTELIYGVTSNQLRTAEEANVKQQNLSIRPDDMANKTEDFMSKVARKEAMAMRWMLEGKDVQAYLGPIGAMVWDQLVLSTDMDEVTKEFRYRIEAGSMRKPNKQRQIADANQSIQVFAPLMQQYMMATGDVNPVNGLIDMFNRANEENVPKLSPIPQQPPPQPGAPPDQKPQGPPQAGPPQQRAA